MSENLNNIINAYVYFISAILFMRAGKLVIREFIGIAKAFYYNKQASELAKERLFKWLN